MQFSPVILSTDFINETKLALPHNTQLHEALEGGNIVEITQQFDLATRWDLNAWRVLDMLENGKSQELLEELKPLKVAAEFQKRWKDRDPSIFRSPQ